MSDFSRSNVQAHDYSQEYYVIYLKVAKRPYLKYSHHTKKKCQLCDMMKVFRNAIW